MSANAASTPELSDEYFLPVEFEKGWVGFRELIWKSDPGSFKRQKVLLQGRLRRVGREKRGERKSGRPGALPSRTRSSVFGFGTAGCPTCRARLCGPNGFCDRREP